MRPTDIKLGNINICFNKDPKLTRSIILNMKAISAVMNITLPVEKKRPDKN